jgi:hypothetical protein
MSSRPSLRNRLAKFEHTIADNAQHSSKGMSFLTNVAANLSTKSCVADTKAPSTPTTFASSTYIPTGALESIPMPPLATKPIPRSLCVEEVIEDVTEFSQSSRSLNSSTHSHPIPHDPSSAMDDLSDIEAILEGLDIFPQQVPKTNSKLEELESSMELSFNEEESDEANGAQALSFQESSSQALQASVAQLYNPSLMLLDWDYQMSACKYRLQTLRKSKVDTGAKISLKDRMKAFSN